MSSMKCNGCGGDTNTVLCIYEFAHPEKGASECAARWEDGEWVKGCVVDAKVGKDLRKYVQEIIDNSHKRKRNEISAKRKAE